MPNLLLWEFKWVVNSVMEKLWNGATPFQKKKKKIRSIHIMRQLNMQNRSLNLIPWLKLKMQNVCWKKNPYKHKVLKWKIKAIVVTRKKMETHVKKILFKFK